ncbi:hypothetical protein Tco_0018324 [Tanacetum coccineum]
MKSQAVRHLFFLPPVSVILEITSAFTITIPPPPLSFNPLPQQETPTPTPTASKVTTSFLTLPNFSSVFKFNDRVTNLEKDLSEMKQVDREEALADKREYIDLIDTSVRAIIKEEVKTQLPQILPQAVSDFATPVIEQNVTKSLEVVILAKSSSQPKSTYAAAALLLEFELTKILMDKMEEHKSYLRADYKRELYDALVKSYNTDKDLFETYGEIFTLKRSQDDKDKDQDPSDGSDRGTKRRKSSKEVESSRDPKSKESKSSSSFKGTSHSQHKSSCEYAHAEEPSHTVDVSGVQQNQEFDTSNNDEQPDDEAAFKRQHVDFRPSQTWISNLACAEKPPTSFDELMDTPIDFSAFVMNRLNITNLTHELLVRPIPNHRGRHVIPFDYFINNDLEYLKGESLIRKYLTSITKTKAATYEVKWIEDMVPNLWSPVKVVYDKHAYWVTSLKIMKWYDYGHMDEIEVRREDQQLYKFKEGDFPRLRLQDIKDMLLLLVQ